MTSLTVIDLAKEYDGRAVFAQVSFTLAAGEKAALFGPNGAGKTTVLRIVAGELEPDGGSARVAPGLRLGYLPQQVLFAPGTTPLSVCEEAAAANEAGADPGEALSRFGFEPDSYRTGTDLLSAGERTRLGLARLWLARPDILLLDEPTNHLDLAGLSWLAAFVREYRGTILLVSHDRYFLDGAVGEIIELSPGGARTYKGNYSAYARQKDAELARQEELYEARAREERRLEQRISEQMEWFRRAHRNAGKKAEMRGAKWYYRARAKKMAHRAKATVSRLEKLREEKVERPRETARMEPVFADSGRTGRTLVRAGGLSKSYGRTLFASSDFAVMRGDRVGIIGPNGCGKTTLLRIILGEESPDEGDIWLSPGARPFYFDQKLSLLPLKRTVLEAVCADSMMQPREIRDLLASMLFRGADVDKEISILSWGERVRAALAVLLARGYNLLALDEPTNNLDVASREAVEESLAAYGGTLLLVSHDRYLLSRLCTRLLVLGGGAIDARPCTYPEYEETLEREKAAGGRKNGETPDPAEAMLLEHRLALLSARLGETGDASEKAALEAEFIALARKRGR